MIDVATQCFAIPASPALVEGVARLATPVDERARVERLRSVAGLYVDAIVEGLILGLVRDGGSSGSTTTSLLERLAGVVKGVSHGLIRGALSNPTDEELVQLEAYLCDQVREVSWQRDERVGIVFPISPGLHAKLASCFAASHAGRATENRGAYADAMIGFIDSALHYYLVLPFSFLRLGRLLRAAVDVGHSTIAKASHTAARHAAEHDGEAELLTLTRFLETRLVSLEARLVVLESGAVDARSM